MTHVGDNFIAVNLCPVKHGVVAALDGDGFAAVYRGFSPLSTVTFLAAFCRINAGKDADTGTVTTGTDTDTHATATAAVPARCFLCVCGATQQNIIRGIQACVTTGLKLASCNHNISAVIAPVFAGCDNRQIIPGIQRTAGYYVTFRMLL
ncbi:hypothetical protein BvCmsOUNP003_04915 [Escherichia coli]|nr:hypothetical protein BvCmsKSNP013_01280 [Escherichia coli]GDP97333.1 hypothetical protein BvCmsOUNP003_04915 [Escherichia coli]